ncbi:MAG: hypothetical protein R3318_01805 [Gammaproteobacteria bacterium]|nr:hypothetical protein [Gammaproteobacteria bacterium]
MTSSTTVPAGTFTVRLPEATPLEVAGRRGVIAACTVAAQKINELIIGSKTRYFMAR